MGRKFTHFLSVSFIGELKQIKKGFTLAEVLITLAVIGIVAALTIPTVMNNYNKQT